MKPMKKGEPGFAVMMALKPKNGSKDPDAMADGEDDDEDKDMDEDETPDHDEAMEDAGKAARTALEAKDDMGFAQAIASIHDLHREMTEAASPKKD